MMMAMTVMDTEKCLHENISALADGELAIGDLELAFAVLGTVRGKAAWEVYDRIGHALRTENCGSELSGDFLARLASRLVAEDLLGQGLGRRNPLARADNEACDAANSLP